MDEQEKQVALAWLESLGDKEFELLGVALKPQKTGGGEDLLYKLLMAMTDEEFAEYEKWFYENYPQFLEAAEPQELDVTKLEAKSAQVKQPASREEQAHG